MLGIDWLSKAEHRDRPEVVRICEAERRPRSRVALGFFDGVHLGHRAVIQGCETVVTFDPHPRRVLSPAPAPRMLMSLEHRITKLGTLGVREVVVIPFDRSWAAMAPMDFADLVLMDRLQPAQVSVGANFRFGARAAGTPEILREIVRTCVLGLVSVGGQVVSSSRIRALVASGDLERVGHLMGGPLIHMATRRPDGRLLLDSELAMPAPGCYHAVVDDAATTVRVHKDGPHVSTPAIPTTDRVPIRFIRRTS